MPNVAEIYPALLGSSPVISGTLQTTAIVLGIAMLIWLHVRYSWPSWNRHRCQAAFPLSDAEEWAGTAEGGDSLHSWLFKEFDLSAYGFLPATEPLQSIATKVPEFEKAASRIWELNEAQGSATREMLLEVREPIFEHCQTRKHIRLALSDNDFTQSELQRLYVILTTIVHSFVWSEKARILGERGAFAQSLSAPELEEIVPAVVPHHLGLPYIEVSSLLGFRKPVLTHTGADLWNWRGPLYENGDVNNLTLNTWFSSNPGEAWFHLQALKISHILGVLMVPAFVVQQMIHGFLEKWDVDNEFVREEGRLDFFAELRQVHKRVSAFLVELRIALKRSANQMKRTAETSDVAKLTAAEEDCRLRLQRSKVKKSNQHEHTGGEKKKLDPHFFYGKYRHFLQGWGPNENFPTGVAFEMYSDDITGEDSSMNTSSPSTCFLKSMDDPPFIALVSEPFLREEQKRVMGTESEEERFSAEYVTNGASAGQAGVFQVIDAFLGVKQRTDFMQKQRAYMPIRHARFIEYFEGQKTVKDYFSFLDRIQQGVEQKTQQRDFTNLPGDPAVAEDKHSTVRKRGVQPRPILPEQDDIEDKSKKLLQTKIAEPTTMTNDLELSEQITSITQGGKDEFLAVIDSLAAFRNVHRFIAKLYVEDFLPNALGTGGTALGQFLQARVDDTKEATSVRVG